MGRQRKYAVPMKVVRLLRKVQKHILEEPKRFEMNLWAGNIGNNLFDQEESRFPKCGTTACIAGWTTILGKPGIKKDKKGHWILPADSTIIRFASKTLGLKPECALTGAQQDAYYDAYCNDKVTYDGPLVDDQLFHHEHWPEPFRSKFADRLDTGNSDARYYRNLAKLASDRIEHFLTTGR